MAFSFGASNPSGGGGGNVPAELGPELPEVFTEVSKAVDAPERARAWCFFFLFIHELTCSV